MSVQIEAHFDSRDSADFAIARLRRSGISFGISDIRPARGRRLTNDDHTVGGVSMLFPFVSNDVYHTFTNDTTGGMFEPYGSRGIMTYSDNGGNTAGPGISTETIVVLSVSEKSADRAEAILRNAHGYGLRVKH